ncbi:het domain protein [Apiospora aurea]|uniref:Het domain protein n=1 Tax=Apiospora aurea TaxID=335848 RepID=A0ABR1QW72_9PEZI
MRLLDTTNLKLTYFTEGQQEPYAILSHTWGHEEVTLQELEQFHDAVTQESPLAGTISSRAGFQKIQSCCDQARRDGLRWAWVDTCCIDKTSSAELSESINSMFKWYQRSDVCYAYLADVLVDPQSPPEWFAEADSSFRDSAWYTRGWTLQELIAPRQVRFYDGAWNIIGQMTEGSRLCEVVSQITSIPPAFLCGTPLSRACVAKRMSWACARKTTREEDIAYCLLGIFDVNMPLLYGEGPKAFYRLQEEIIKRTNDQTILAWGDLPSDGADSSTQDGPGTKGLLFSVQIGEYKSG